MIYGCDECDRCDGYDAGIVLFGACILLISIFGLLNAYANGYFIPFDSRCQHSHHIMQDSTFSLDDNHIFDGSTLNAWRDYVIQNAIVVAMVRIMLFQRHCPTHSELLKPKQTQRVPTLFRWNVTDLFEQLFLSRIPSTTRDFSSGPHVNGSKRGDGISWYGDDNTWDTPPPLALFQ